MRVCVRVCVCEGEGEGGEGVYERANTLQSSHSQSSEVSIQRPKHKVQSAQCW